jgi:hypothetical protein
MIRGFPERPDSLLKKGYARREEPTAYLEHRDVYYIKRIGRLDSALVFELQIRYELFISDSPCGPSIDNFNYHPSTRFLVVWEKTGQEDPNGLPELRKIGESELFVSSLAELEKLGHALGSADTWR